MKPCSFGIRTKQSIMPVEGIRFTVTTLESYIRKRKLELGILVHRKGRNQCNVAIYRRNIEAHRNNEIVAKHGMGKVIFIHQYKGIIDNIA